MTATVSSRPAATAVRIVTTPVLAALALLGAYLLLSLLNDPMGSLGTDTGGKVATMEVMADRPLGLDPDVGYWAAADDPTGGLHGLYYTGRLDDRYVNVTTLPVLELGAPLYRLGGYRAALLLPMAGAIAAAFAARRLVGQFGGEDSLGWKAFWLVGLASPLVVYALDFWEHSIGVALIAWGVVGLVHVWRGAPGPGWGLLVGLAFGAAFSLRTESLVYGFTATACACGALVLVRRLRDAVVLGGGVVVGLAAAAGANLLLEQAAVGQSLRAERASGTASAGGADVLVRVKEALVTGLGLVPSLDADRIVVGVLLAVALVTVAATAGRPGLQRVSVAAAAIAVGLYLFRFAEGLGFVPGLLAATPLAAVALARPPRDSAARLVLAIAVGSLPLVWYFQYTGGASPQWAGRYILPSGLLLVAVAMVSLPLLPQWTRRAFVGASIVVTVFGLAWLSERSHEVGRAARDVAALDVPAVVAREAFWLRELGAVYEGEGTTWLSAADEDGVADAVELVRTRSLDGFAYLDARAETDEVPAFAGFEIVEERRYDWLDLPFRVVVYERAGANVSS